MSAMTVAPLRAARVTVVATSACQPGVRAATMRTLSARSALCVLPRRLSAPGPVPRRVAVTAQTGGTGVRASATATAEDSGLTQADPSRWITGFTPNNMALRAGAVAATLALASQGKALGLSVQALTFLHTLVYGTWWGSMFYTTFVAGIVMFKSLPRQTFRDVQEVLFPAYFQLHTLAIALLGVLAPLAFSAVTRQQWVLLGVSFVATLANLLWLEPATTAVMKKRASLEKTTAAVAGAFYPEGKDAAMKKLGKEFGKLHGLSSMANLVAMCTCIAYGHSLL